MEREMNQLFRSIYETYQAPLRTIARRYGVEYDDIDDVVQETFAAYYQYYLFKDGEEIGNIKAMLTKILKNKCVDLYRRNCRIGKVEWDPEEGRVPAAVLLRCMGKDVSDLVIENHRYMEIRGIIDAMKPDWRDVVYYCCVLEYSPSEASELLGISGTACRSRLMRARIYLRKKLGPEYMPQFAE